MARVHYWQYIVDEEGRPLEGVDIRFYLNDNPSEEAEIFVNPAIGRPTTTSEADLKTDGNGYFEFWIGDEFEPLGGYISTQKFRITWQRAGILLGQINNIDIFPPIFQVDETDNVSSTKDDKNKLVSNALAYKWDSHVDAQAADRPHGFAPVNINSTSLIYNKLVSNSLINYILSAISSAGTISIQASAAVERNFSITSWQTSGSDYYADLDHFIGRQFPIVQLRESPSNEMIIPKRIVSVDTNKIRVFVSADIDAEVTIVG